MAEQTDPASVNYSQYANWERVVAPNGAVYYKVPNTGYLYDPFLSASKGRPVLFTDPRADIAERDRQIQEQKDKENRVISQQERASSPIGQLTPVIGSVGGLVGANYLVDAVKSPTLANLVNTPSGIVTAMSDGTLGGPGMAAAQNAATVASTPAQAAIQGASLQSPISYSPVGSSLEAPAADSMSTFAGSATPYLGAAATAFGAYNAFEGIKDKNPLGAGLGGLGAGLGLNMMGIGLGPVGWGAMLAAPAAAAFINGMTDKNMFQTEQKRLQKLKEDGYNVGDILTLQQGRSKEQLIKEAEATGDQATIDFANTRNESFLTAPQIQGYSTIYERVGKNGTAADRLAAAQNAVDAQAAGFNVLREHDGTVDVDWAQVDEWKKSKEVAPAQQGNGISQPVAAPAITGPVEIVKQNPNVNAPVAIMTKPAAIATPQPRFGGIRLSPEQAERIQRMGQGLANRMNSRA